MNDGSYLPVFMPLLLAIVGLRPLPNYFVHACDYVDLKVVKEGGKAGSKPLTELLLQEYGSDLQGSLGVDYVLRMLDAFNVKTGYFPNSQVIAWIVPKSLKAKLCLRGEAGVPADIFTKLMTVANLIQPKLPVILSASGGNWKEFQDTARRQLLHMFSASPVDPVQAPTAGPPPAASIADPVAPTVPACELAPPPAASIADPVAPTVPACELGVCEAGPGVADSNSNPGPSMPHATPVSILATSAMAPPTIMIVATTGASVVSHVVAGHADASAPPASTARGALPLPAPVQSPATNTRRHSGTAQAPATRGGARVSNAPTSAPPLMPSTVTSPPPSVPAASVPAATAASGPTSSTQ